MIFYLVISEIICCKKLHTRQYKAKHYTACQQFGQNSDNEWAWKWIFPTGVDPHQFKVQELCQVFLGEGHTAELEFKSSFFINKKIVLNDRASSRAVGCEVFVYKLVAVSLTKLCFFFQVMVLLTLTAQQLLRRRFLL